MHWTSIIATFIMNETEAIGATSKSVSSVRVKRTPNYMTGRKSLIKF